VELATRQAGVPSFISGSGFIVFDSIHCVGHNGKQANRLCQLFLFALFICQPAWAILWG
jgi:hypothetical protein